VLRFRRSVSERQLIHRLKLVDHAFDDLQTLVPELRLARIEPERRQQFRVVLRSASFQQFEVFRDEARVRFRIETVERVYETIAERVSVDVEGRMDEVRDVRPENIVAVLQIDGRAKAFG